MNKGLFFGVLTASLIACSNEPISITEIVLRSPGNSARAIDLDQLQVEVNIDGQPYPVIRSDTVWRGDFILPTDRELPLQVRWFFDQLPIASFETTIGPIESNATLTVRPEDYISTGSEYDADADGISNLQELTNCTDPQDSTNIDVRIPRLTAGDNIGINGVSGLLWAANVTTNFCGDQLQVDNLMVDQGAQLADEETGFYWQATYNDESLFIIVFAENASNSTPIGDSSVTGRDDAIHIFIDGDNSKLNSYDGVNDIHIVIPLLKRLAPATVSPDQLALDSNGDLIFDQAGNVAIEDASGVTVFVPAGEKQANHGRDADGRIDIVKLDSRVSGNLVFQNGIPSDGPQIYELSISLDAIDVTIGQPFGFEIQIDDDIDGGDKEARYAWKHPSKLTDGADVNNTINDPSFMGTVILD